MKTKLFSIIAAIALLPLSIFGQTGERLPAFDQRTLKSGTAPVNGTNCIQTLTFGATITGGTFKLAFDGKTTAAITWSATNATLVANIDAAVEALATVGIGGVTTTAGTIVAGVNGTITVTHTGDRSKQVVPAITIADNSMVGAAHTLTSAITTPGVEADGRISPKGTLCIAIDTGILYQNSGTPPNPVWGKVSAE
jgi:hypothetical protein